MKNKLLLLLAIIAVVGIAVTLNYGKIWAQQDQEPPLTIDEKTPIKVEFSNFPDKRAEMAGGWGLNPRDGQQVLYTLEPDEEEDLLTRRLTPGTTTTSTSTALTPTLLLKLTH